MGNLIVTGASVFVPLFNEIVTIPYLYSPLRWGGIPWSPPNSIYVNMTRIILNIIVLIILGTLSGLMTTERQCRRLDLWLSIKRSSWVLLGYFVGNVFLTLIPMIKAPLLALLIWLPYAGWIAHGLIVALFILFLGSFGNAYQRAETC